MWLWTSLWDAGLEFLTFCRCILWNAPVSLRLTYPLGQSSYLGTRPWDWKLFSISSYSIPTWLLYLGQDIFPFQHWHLPGAKKNNLKQLIQKPVETLISGLDPLADIWPLLWGVDWSCTHGEGQHSETCFRAGKSCIQRPVSLGCSGCYWCLLLKLLQLPG